MDNPDHIHSFHTRAISQILQTLKISNLKIYNLPKRREYEANPLSDFSTILLAVIKLQVYSKNRNMILTLATLHFLLPYKVNQCSAGHSTLKVPKLKQNVLFVYMDTACSTFHGR